MHRGHLGKEATLATVCTLIKKQRSPASDHMPIGSDGCFQLDVHALSPMTNGEELFLAREDQLDGSLGGASERCYVPPPSNGTMTRTLAWGTSNAAATVVRAAYGTWLDVQMVTRSPCHSATTARGSMGTPCEGSVV
jgi:hypothetical protein